MSVKDFNSIFYRLKYYDTPTICNALELIDSNRKNYGYTDEVLFCLKPNMPPIVGLAKTATCRSLCPSEKNSDELKLDRVEYYKYVDSGEYPKVIVMQDLDGTRSGHGPFFGEFNSRIHKALGCEGVVTNGSIRDVPNIPSDFQILSCGIKPSHANIHIVSYDIQVNVASMVVNPGDVIHADLHGAVSFPLSLAETVLEKANEFIESESPILEACKKNENLRIEEIIELYLKR